MKIIGIQTARAGSKSVKNKNVISVKGKPLYQHNLQGMLQSENINNVVVTTDIEIIFNENHPKLFIHKRPVDLIGDNASHSDTIREALFATEKKENVKYDIIVVTLGNSMSCYTEDLDAAINLLADDDSLDSVMSVSEFNMFNPFRAYKINGERLQTFLPQKSIKSESTKNINDKKSAGDIYFFNGGFWVIKRKALIEEQGLLPFPWLGENIGYLIQDTEMEVDAQWQLDYLMKRI